MCKRVERICQVDPEGWYAPVIGEELVRCKDCQYYVDECCERYADETLGYVHSTQPDYFCAVAARAEDADS